MLDSDHIVLGNTISDNHTEFELGLEGFEDCCGCSGGRDIDDRSIAVGGLLSLETGCEDIKSEMFGSCFLGVDSSNHLGLVIKCLLGLEAALIACNSLADDLGVLVDPDIGCSGG